jgi:hypothetical protein
VLEDDRAVGSGLGDRLAVEHDAAGIGPDEAADDVEERRLAAAGVADDRDELAVRDVEVDAAEHLLRA